MALRRKTEPPDNSKAPVQEGPDREGLLAALGRLKPALRTGGAIPELGHIWFESGRASAYDGGLGIRLALDTGLTCGAPGRPLMGLLGTSALKQVTLEQEEADLLVRLGKSKTKLKVLPSERDPWPFPAQHPGKSARISEAAIEALRAVLVVKPSPATRLEHHGVLVYCSGSDIDVYATDSRTIAQATYSEKATGLPKFLFVPRPLAEQIVVLCPRGTELYVAEDHLAAVGNGVELCSNVLDTTGMVDIPKVVRKTHDPHPDSVALPAGLEAALDRAEVLAGSSDESVITVTVRGRNFSLAGKYQYGELQEDLVLEADHPDVEIAVVTSALRRGMLSADAFSSTKESMAFYGGDNFLYLVAART